MMKTTILVTILLLFMLSASGVYAQKVRPDLVDGYPAIYCDEMPSSMYTTTAKGSTEAVLKTAAANEQVYQYFAVSNKDNSISSNWSTAFTHCSNVSGGSWRLPTQRELMLMWVLKFQLERTSGFTKFNASEYWSATESNSNNSWSVLFSNGNTYSNTKSGNYRVRCVRELTE